MIHVGGILALDEITRPVSVTVSHIIRRFWPPQEGKEGMPRLSLLLGG